MECVTLACQELGGGRWWSDGCRVSAQGEGELEAFLNGEELFHVLVGEEDEDHEHHDEDGHHDHRRRVEDEDHHGFDEGRAHFRFRAAAGRLLLRMTSSDELRAQLYVGIGEANAFPPWPFPLLSEGEAQAIANDPSSVTLSWSPVLERRVAAAALLAEQEAQGDPARDIVYDIIYHADEHHEDEDAHGSSCGEFFSDDETTVISGVMLRSEDHDHRRLRAYRRLTVDHTHVHYRIRGLEASTEYHFDIIARNLSSGQTTAYGPAVVSTPAVPIARDSSNVGLIVGLCIAGLIIGSVVGVTATRRWCPTPSQAGFKAVPTSLQAAAAAGGPSSSSSILTPASASGGARSAVAKHHE